jgi:hypothetical protein
MLIQSKPSPTAHWQIYTRDFKPRMDINPEDVNGTAYRNVWKAFDFQGHVVQKTDVMYVSEKAVKKKKKFLYVRTFIIQEK